MFPGEDLDRSLLIGGDDEIPPGEGFSFPPPLIEVQPGSFPFLVIEKGQVLAEGTVDLSRDAETQDEYEKAMKAETDNEEGDYSLSKDILVQGELFTFSEVDKLGPIDALEGFNPGETGFYNRVLVMVLTHRGVRPAWTYVIEEGSQRGNEIAGGCWPTGRVEDI